MKRLFLLMTICAMAFMASCENGGENGKNAHLKVTSSTLIEVGAAGDTVAVTYQLNKPIDGETVKTNVTAGREAITSITEPAAGVILVAVAPNATGEERSAVLELSYASDKVTIVITQSAGNGGDDPTGGQDKDAQSTLTGDHVITFPDSPRAKWIYEGDWWKTGYSNYTIMIMNKYNGYVSGDTLQLDIITDNTDKNGDFYGTYNISYTPGKSVAMAGFTDNELRAVGCWYFEYGSGGGNYKNFAMLVKGSLSISDNGDGTSTVVLDAYDCYDHHVTCSWSGEIEKD